MLKLTCKCFWQTVHSAVLKGCTEIFVWIFSMPLCLPGSWGMYYSLLKCKQQQAFRASENLCEVVLIHATSTRESGQFQCHWALASKNWLFLWTRVSSKRNMMSQPVYNYITGVFPRLQYLPSSIKCWSSAHWIIIGYSPHSSPVYSPSDSSCPRVNRDRWLTLPPPYPDNLQAHVITLGLFSPTSCGKFSRNPAQTNSILLPPQSTPLLLIPAIPSLQCMYVLCVSK